MYDQVKEPNRNTRLPRFEIVIEIISICLILGVLMYIWVNWKLIPDRIPVHFGITGEADRWGTKLSLLRTPIIMILFYSLLTILSRLPHLYNIPFNITERTAELQNRNVRLLLSCLKMEIISLFAYTHYKTILIAINNSGGLGGLSIVGFLMIILTTIGYFTVSMYKTDKKLKC